MKDALVRTSALTPGAGLPLLIEPVIRGMDLALWAENERVSLTRLLHQHGGLLFRGFEISGVAQFQAVVQKISGDLLEYKEQTSPRSKVSGNVYTSTEYPPHQRIFMHNENSYSSTWPRKIMFFCLTPAATGGATPIADVRRVLNRIPALVQERFDRLGWMLVRNFGTGYGLTWQTAFQTANHAEVNQHCERNGIEYEWIDEERLRIRQRRPAIVTHPDTGERVWFNHAAFFHLSTLEPEVRQGLISEMPEADLPYNTYYGDGSPIELEVLDVIREAYRQETIEFQWQKHDLLVLDNMLVAHGRAPFEGPRKILVAMTEPYSIKSGE